MLLDELVEAQLNLQVKISYEAHHAFLLRHELKECGRVLDVGSGNGAFASRLALDHPEIEFVGIDKRKYCIDSSKKAAAKNLSFEQVDMFDQKSNFDFSQFDGFLMRYFLLHVDHSKKILELFKNKAKRPSKFWIIDLDYSQTQCEPKNETFDKLLVLIKEFCAKKSVDSLAGQRILPMLEASGFQNIQVENLPFSSQTVPLNDLALYLKQEVLCYSFMIGRPTSDPETLAIIKFIDEEAKTGKFQISYGMILLSADFLV